MGSSGTNGIISLTCKTLRGAKRMASLTFTQCMNCRLTVYKMIPRDDEAISGFEYDAVSIKRGLDTP